MEEEEKRAFDHRSTLRWPPTTPQQVFLSPTSSPEKPADMFPTTLRATLGQMGAVLEGLTVWFNRQRYITTVRRVEIMQRSCLQKLAVEPFSTELVSSGVQTTPTVIRPNIEAERTKQGVSFKNAMVASGRGNDTPKRQRDPSWEQRKTPPKKSKRQIIQQQAEVIPQYSGAKLVTQRASSSSRENWTMVNKRQKQRDRIRTDAIAVSGVGTCSYSDILKMVKSDPSLKHLSNDVRNIRKAANGDLLLRLDRKPMEITDELKDAVSKALGRFAVVKNLTKTAQPNWPWRTHLDM